MLSLLTLFKLWHNQCCFAATTLEMFKHYYNLALHSSFISKINAFRVNLCLSTSSDQRCELAHNPEVLGYNVLPWKLCFIASSLLDLRHLTITVTVCQSSHIIKSSKTQTTNRGKKKKKEGSGGGDPLLFLDLTRNMKKKWQPYI